jgi:hypothetical protein
MSFFRAEIKQESPIVLTLNHIEYSNQQAAPPDWLADLSSPIDSLLDPCVLPLSPDDPVSVSLVRFLFSILFFFFFFLTAFSRTRLVNRHFILCCYHCTYIFMRFVK